MAISLPLASLVPLGARRAFVAGAESPFSVDIEGTSWSAGGDAD